MFSGWCGVRECLSLWSRGTPCPWEPESRFSPRRPSAGPPPARHSGELAEVVSSLERLVRLRLDVKTAVRSVTSPWNRRRPARARLLLLSLMAAGLVTAGRLVVRPASNGRRDMGTDIGRSQQARPDRYIELERRSEFGEHEVLVAPSGLEAIGEFVYLLDRDDRRLRKLQVRDLSLITAHGRRGAGPGEFGTPFTLQRTPDGQLVVWDQELQRVTWFDADFAYVRGRRYEIPWARWGYVDDLIPLGGDTLVTVTRSWPTASRQDTSVLTLTIFLPGKTLRTIGRYPGPELVTYLEEQVLRESARTARIPEHVWRERFALLKQRTVPFPSDKPIWEDFVLSADGQIWVRLFGDRPGPRTWLRFDARQRQVGRVIVPHAGLVSLSIAVGDLLIATEKDTGSGAWSLALYGPVRG